MGKLKVGKLMNISDIAYDGICPEKDCDGTIEIDDVITDFGDWGFTLVCDTCGTRFSAEFEKARIEKIDEDDSDPEEDEE